MIDTYSNKGLNQLFKLENKARKLLASFWKIQLISATKAPMYLNFFCVHACAQVMITTRDLVLQNQLSTLEEMQYMDQKLIMRELLTFKHDQVQS